MPVERKMVELGEEIKKLPGYDIYFHYIKGLELSRYIFDKNYQDLVAILNFVTVDPKGNELHRVENKDKLTAFGYEIVCKLHNYITAVETLVSHSRNIHVRLCEKNNLFPDYDERVNADFNNNPLAGFIQELRNYFLHEQSPDISFNTRFDSQGKPIRRAYISLQHLNEKGDWKARSQVFLQNLTEDVDILELATSFKLKVATFQDWFRMRILEVFKEELALLDDKMVEMQKLIKES
jgi:hypothetical protein